MIWSKSVTPRFVNAGTLGGLYDMGLVMRVIWGRV